MILKPEMTLMTVEKVVNGDSLECSRVAEGTRKECTMKWLIGFQICSTILILLMIGTSYLVAYSIMKEIKVFENITHNYSTPNESIVTLYALDPLARTFCFGDGKYGQIFSDGSIYNRRSDIDFNNYNNGSFSVGIEGAEVGAIIDLGSSADVQKKYKYQETIGNGQGFASIHRKNRTLFILKNNSYDHIFQPMEESNELFQSGRSVASASVTLGHLYLLRITDATDVGFERIVKMLVIAYQPYEWVTIRWEILT